MPKIPHFKNVIFERNKDASGTSKVKKCCLRKFISVAPFPEMVKTYPVV